MIPLFNLTVSRSLMHKIGVILVQSTLENAGLKCRDALIRGYFSVVSTMYVVLYVLHTLG